jgi:hypothetical protein
MQIIHYSSQILVKLEFLVRVSKNPEMSYFMNIRPVVSDLFHPDRREEGRTEMTKLKMANKEDNQLDETITVY